MQGSSSFHGFIVADRLLRCVRGFWCYCILSQHECVLAERAGNSAAQIIYRLMQNDRTGCALVDFCCRNRCSADLRAKIQLWIEMKTPWIAPSILSADFARLGQDVEQVMQAGADIIHFDVMDNHYVPNLSFGPMVCSALRAYGITDIIDVHLMVKPVDRLIPEFAQAGANYITFHPEASDHVDRTLQLIIDNGCKAGLVFNPATPLSNLEHVLDKLDMILLMSVNPGYGGQSFIPSTLNKLKQARKIIDESGFDIRLEVDGGVKTDNIAEIAACGADTFVAGSAIFASDDYEKTIAQMKRSIENSSA